MAIYSADCRNSKWWNKHTKLERTLCLMTIIMFLALVGMAATLVALGYLYKSNTDARQHISSSPNADKFVSHNSKLSRETCLTPGCVKAAADILESLDENTDPCDNFFQFSCGGWIDKHVIPDDRSYVSIDTDIEDDLNLKLRVLLEKKFRGTEPAFVKMIKEFYDSCMNIKYIEKSGSEPLQKVLKYLGGWPVVLGDKWDESNFDWIEKLFAFRKIGYSLNILLQLHVTVDYRNNTVHIIDLDETSLGMPDRSYLIKGLNDSATTAYFNLMVRTANKLGANNKTSEKELMEALNFEIALANLTLPHEERRNFDKFYNKYTVKKLQEKIPQIDWLKYLNGLLSDTITENETILVAVPEFFTKFAELMDKTDERVIANYMIWRVVGSSLGMLSKEWRDLAQDYSTVIDGTSQEEPRWEQCLSSLTDSLEIALGSYYVRNFFKEDSKHRAMELVMYVHKEFLKILEDVDWMEENTKTEAQEKAKAIKTYIGYPQELLNNTLLMEFYENLTITNISYFDNILRLSKWSTDYTFSKLRKPHIKGEWKIHADAAAINAYYDSLENSIEFPAGILQKNYFDKDRPQYLNFGGIGSVIGHEITHGFDDTGRQFDKNGNNVNWWDASTDELFKEKAECIIHQYGNYTAEIGLQINGINTQGENIADNGGLKEAYLGYQSWVKDNGREQQLPGLKYTPNQLFWISAANVWCSKIRPENLKLNIISGSHSPDKFRVIGPMSNLPQFSKDFQCPLGSPMNPHKKCKVW